MNSLITPNRNLAFAVTASCVMGLLAAAMIGCGDGRPRRVPVSGQVLIDGEPLTHGQIRLTPANARPATAEIAPDGRFTLTTFDEGDGVVPGVHPVSVAANEYLSETRQRWHAPKKYADPTTSGLTATVDGPNDSLVITLSWEGGKPFVEED
ncbi:MAG: DUF4198 domain-containing protein [Pirellulaceae bacterium]|nr:DUF4198 domain-containing protein [Pirellulaceae bacterium]